MKKVKIIFIFSRFCIDPLFIMHDPSSLFRRGVMRRYSKDISQLLLVIQKSFCKYKPHKPQIIMTMWFICNIAISKKSFAHYKQKYSVLRPKKPKIWCFITQKQKHIWVRQDNGKVQNRKCRCRQKGIIRTQKTGSYYSFIKTFSA